LSNAVRQVFYGDAVTKEKGSAVRCISILALIIFLAAPLLSAGDKPGAEVDGKKLIGKWEWGGKEYHGWIVFTSDGVIMTQATKIGTTTPINEGKYTLEGDKLTFVVKNSAEKEEKIVVIITKLTDGELQYRYSGDNIQSLKRAKPKK
jgi:uncharacterized protein (TIGR03066 family)